MSDKAVVIHRVRENMAMFIIAARQLRTDLEDLGLLGYMPDGDNPITDADMTDENIDAATFFAGVDAFAVLNPTPTPDQSKALARIAARH